MFSTSPRMRSPSLPAGRTGDLRASVGHVERERAGRRLAEETSRAVSLLVTAMALSAVVSLRCNRPGHQRARRQNAGQACTLHTITTSAA